MLTQHKYCTICGLPVNVFAHATITLTNESVSCGLAFAFASEKKLISSASVSRVGKVGGKKKQLLIGSDY